jgi:hypothetical protein
MTDSEMKMSGQLQSPDLKKSKGSLVPRARAIKDEAHAKKILTNMQTTMQDPHKTAARIMAKYNAEKPYRQSALNQEGVGYRSNFTTKPLAQMIDKVAPRFVEAVQGMKYLTSAALPADVLGSTEKTDAFRREITDTCRTRKGWRIFLEDLAQEDGMFGYALAAWLDEYSWFPRALKFDETYLPEGTPQLAESAQLVVVKEVYLPHELFDKVEDVEAATAIGWYVDECVEAINNASPEGIKSANTSDLQLLYENLRRELGSGCSFQYGAAVIPVYSILAREVDGKVSHWRLGGSEGNLKLLFKREDRFENMMDSVAFYSFQKGSGKMRGSKGVGRDIYELAGMIDRARNEAVDRLCLSGKMIFQGDPKALKRFKMNVIGNAILIEEGVQMAEKTFDGEVDGFLKLDAYLGQIVDQLIGSTSPPKVEGEAFRSPEAWKLYAAREEESKDSRVSRFVDQFVDMMATIQRRLCNTDTDEKDALAMQKRLLKLMTREELDQLANQPPAGTVQDLSPIERQQVIVAASENSGNPLFNQRQLMVEKLTSQVNAEFATKVLLPENDPTVQAEQSRNQQMELLLLQTGAPVPVSPRDSHQIHLEILYPLLEQTAGAVMQGQVGTASLEGIVAHANEHMQMAIQQGVKAEEFKGLKQLIDQALQAVTQLKALDEKAAKLQEDDAARAAEGQPQPPAAPAPQPML